MSELNSKILVVQEYLPRDLAQIVKSYLDGLPDYIYPGALVQTTRSGELRRVLQIDRDFRVFVMNGPWCGWYWLYGLRPYSYFEFAPIDVIRQIASYSEPVEFNRFTQCCKLFHKKIDPLKWCKPKHLKGNQALIKNDRFLEHICKTVDSWDISDWNTAGCLDWQGLIDYPVKKVILNPVQMVDYKASGIMALFEIFSEIAELHVTIQNVAIKMSNIASRVKNLFLYFDVRDNFRFRFRVMLHESVRAAIETLTIPNTDNIVADEQFYVKAHATIQTVTINDKVWKRDTPTTLTREQPVSASLLP